MTWFRFSLWDLSSLADSVPIASMPGSQHSTAVSKIWYPGGWRAGEMMASHWRDGFALGMGDYLIQRTQFLFLAIYMVAYKHP